MKRKLRRGVVDDSRKGDSYERLYNMVADYKDMQNVSLNTHKGYKRSIESLREYFGDDYDIFTVTSKDARAYIKWLQTDKIHYRDKLHLEGIQRGLKPSTINTYLKVAKTLYDVLLRLEVVSDNPFKDIPCMKRDNERIKTIPPEDIRLLLESLNKAYYTEFRMYVVIHMLLDTFGRIDEVLSLKQSDIDFEKRTAYFAKTKTNDPRYVGFSTKTKRLLEELIDECRDFNSEFIFLGINGERFMPEAFRANLKRYCDIYGIKTHITPHMFRHTAAMLFLENGGNMRVLQKILGHKKIQTTEIYAHVSDNLIMAQQSTYSPIDQVFGAKKSVSKPTRRRR